MAKSPSKPAQIPSVGSSASAHELRGTGDELHQKAGGSHPQLTTNQGIPVGDNQNSLRATPRGPTLLEDFIPVSYTHLTLPTICSV